MSSASIVSTNPTASMMVLNAPGQKAARMSKKDYYAAEGIEALGRGEKERRYAAYAAVFATAGMEAVKCIDGFQLKSIKWAPSGKQYSVVFDKKAVDPVTVEKQLADALKELAALKSEAAKNANAITA